MVRMVYPSVLVLTFMLSLVIPRHGLGETHTTSQQGDTVAQTKLPPSRTEVERLIAVGRLATPDPKDIKYPAGAPPSQAEVELGKALFFERQLSGSQHMSCATCHNPTKGFSDGRPKSIADRGNTMPRNASHLYNLAWNRVLFWDGRQENLDTIAFDPIKSSDEMNLPLDTMVERLKAIPYYAEAFKRSPFNMCGEVATPNLYAVS